MTTSGTRAQKVYRKALLVSTTATCAGAVAGLVLATGGSGTVSAPEPADLTAPLTGTTGATAAAVFSTSLQPTRVLLWPGYFVAGSSPAGTPCSTYGLATGERTYKTIQAMGSLRRCL